MKTLNLKIAVLTIFCYVTSANWSHAQQGSVAINQDKKIETLLNLRKEMNKNDTDFERYKIQIYSGNRATAETHRTDFSSKFNTWEASMEFETPNYKIWVGSFRTKIEADRALKEIQREFKTAFIFKPKK